MGCSSGCDCPSHQPAARRNAWLRSQYGITVDDYLEMFAAQDGLCDICKTDQPGGRGNKSFAVDHDHLTGRVRALLCANCNNGLGRFDDSPTYLRAAADYLERHAL